MKKLYLQPLEIGSECAQTLFWCVGSRKCFRSLHGQRLNCHHKQCHNAYVKVHPFDSSFTQTLLNAPRFLSARLSRLLIASSSFSVITNLVKGHVRNSILLPVVVIEVPPLSLVHGEALRLHRGAQEVAVPTLQ